MEITINDVVEYLSTLIGCSIVGVPLSVNNCLVAEVFKHKYPDATNVLVTDTDISCVYCFHRYWFKLDNALSFMVRDFDKFNVIALSKDDYLSHLSSFSSVRYSCLPEDFSKFLVSLGIEECINK